MICSVARKGHGGDIVSWGLLHDKLIPSMCRNAQRRNLDTSLLVYGTKYMIRHIAMVVRRKYRPWHGVRGREKPI